MSGPEERRTTTAIASSLAGTLDWHAAYEQHAPDLVRFLRRFLRSDEAAQDLVTDRPSKGSRLGDPACGMRGIDVTDWDHGSLSDQPPTTYPPRPR